MPKLNCILIKKNLQVEKYINLGSEIKQAVEALALERGVDVDSMYEALVWAFVSAYKRIKAHDIL